MKRWHEAPWRYDGRRVWSGDNFVGCHICTISEPVVGHMIAAAPALLAALENLEDVIESHIMDDDETQRRLEEALIQAREAIAVAYGEVVQ